jgi:phosphoribosyl 1,2-cyclic phosphate phosphodiesterase
MSRGSELILLGTGTSHGVPMIGCDCPTCTSPDPRNQRTRSGALLRTARGNLLIDTPPELRLQLLREGVARLHAVLFTHSHADHLFGLDDLRIFPHYLGHSLPIFCEEAVERQIRASFGYAFEPITLQYPAGAVPQLEFRRIGTEPFDVLGQHVIPLRLEHGRFRVLGFRFDNVAYCTDVKEIPRESLDRLEGLDVLVLDALRERPHPTHLSLAESLEIVKQLRPKKTYFTHISHNLEHAATNARLPEGVELAYDGLAIPLS